jgi:hypothetical protein
MYRQERTNLLSTAVAYGVRVRVLNRATVPLGVEIDFAPTLLPSGKDDTAPAGCSFPRSQAWHPRAHP